MYSVLRKVAKHRKCTSFVRSHDNSPDLFADNDGSALMKMVMMRFEIIMTMVIIMVMVVVRLDQC